MINKIKLIIDIIESIIKIIKIIINKSESDLDAIKYLFINLKVF